MFFSELQVLYLQDFLTKVYFLLKCNEDLLHKKILKFLLLAK